MRRTLTVLVTAAALLVPATAASAAPAVDRVKSNASCSNGKGGNDNANPFTYNGKGNVARASACLPKAPVVVVVVEEEPPPPPVAPPPPPPTV